MLKENTKNKIQEQDRHVRNLLDKYLELNKTELSLPRLLIDQVVVVLRQDVERIAFLRIELRCMQNDGDLSLENNKHHRVLVCAAHSLGRVALDPEERS